jgi:hypothetical protein
LETRESETADKQKRKKKKKDYILNLDRERARERTKLEISNSITPLPKDPAKEETPSTEKKILSGSGKWKLNLHIR